MTFEEFKTWEREEWAKPKTYFEVAQDSNNPLHTWILGENDRLIMKYREINYIACIWRIRIRKIVATIGNLTNESVKSQITN